MQKYLLILAAIAAVNMVKAQDDEHEQTIYSWESPAGTVIEQGGHATYVNGEEGTDCVNYKNGDYYTLCLKGKKANLDDATPSANAGYIRLGLDRTLVAGDRITITAYRNKNAEGKKASVYLHFLKGTDMAGVEGATYWTNIAADEANADYDNDGNEPNSYTYTITDQECRTIYLTRNDAGTNLFITRVEIHHRVADIIAEPAAGVVESLSTIKLSASDGGTFSYASQSDLYAYLVSVDEYGDYNTEATIGEKQIGTGLQGYDAKWANVKLPKKITAPGVYTLIIPDNFFYVGEGFDPCIYTEFVYTINDTSAIDEVASDSHRNLMFNLFGQYTLDPKGLTIRGGKKCFLK